MKSMMKDAAVLLVITLVAGFLLGGVYQITKEPIAAQAALALEEACRDVFPDAAAFEAEEAFDAAAGEALLVQGGYTAQTVNGVSAALNDAGEVLGYVLTVTTHEGYGGDIRFTMGVRADGSLNGISLLDIAETPGLGMQAEEVLVPQFAQRSADRFAFVKAGAGTGAENEIDAISGATVTTNALTEGVNAGLYYFQEALTGAKTAEGGAEIEE